MTILFPRKLSFVTVFSCIHACFNCYVKWAAVNIPALCLLFNGYTLTSKSIWIQRQKDCPTELYLEWLLRLLHNIFLHSFVFVQTRGLIPVYWFNTKYSRSGAAVLRFVWDCSCIYIFHWLVPLLPLPPPFPSQHNRRKDHPHNRQHNQSGGGAAQGARWLTERYRSWGAPFSGEPGLTWLWGHQCRG